MMLSSTSAAHGSAQAFATVLTTIQPPTPSVRGLERSLKSHDSRLLVLGDEKGPGRFDVEGAEFLNIADQTALGFSLEPLLPRNHYSRKNLGYLLAIREGFTALFDIDDDNHPTAEWTPRTVSTTARMEDSNGWFNVLSRFTDVPIWPRGFPLSMARQMPREAKVAPIRNVSASIQQSLVNRSPDVDAVWRLLFGADTSLRFDSAPSVWLPRSCWCPFNSQATWWFRDAFPLLFLPTSCSPRVSDIWRSLIAQRCIWEIGEGIVFHAADIEQDRNRHDLLIDFRDEVPMHLHNEEIVRVLGALHLDEGLASVGANLHRCYATMVTKGYLHEQELQAVSSWLADLEDCEYTTTG